MIRFISLKEHGLTSLFVFLVALISPFVFSSQLIDPVTSPRMLILLTAAISAFAYYSYRSFQQTSVLLENVFQLPLLPILFAYGLVLLLSAQYAFYPPLSIFEASKYFTLLMVMLAAIILYQQNENLPTLFIRAFAIAAIGLSLIALFQFFQLAFLSIPGTTNMDATLMNRNLLAGALAMLLPLLFWGYRTDEPGWQALYISAFGLSCGIIGLSHARSSWVALIFSLTLLITLLLILKRRSSEDWLQRQFYNKTVLLLIAGSLLTMTFFGMYYYVTKIEKRFEPFQVEKMLTGKYITRSTIYARFHLWEGTTEMIADYPLGGVGAGNWEIFAPAYGLYRDSNPANIGHALRPHNDYLWVMAESGIAGIACYLLIFLLIIYYSIRLIFHETDQEIRLLTLLQLLSIVIFLVIALFSYPKERMVHMTIIMLNFAIISVNYYRRFHPVKVLNRKVFRLICGTGILLSGIIVFTVFNHWEMESNIKTAISSDTAPAAAIQLLKATEESLYHLDPEVNPPAFYRGKIHLANQDTIAAIDAWQHTLAIHPWHTSAMFLLSRIYLKQENFPDAGALLERLINQLPADANMLLDLTRVYLQTGKKALARETLKRVPASSSDPRYKIYQGLLQE